MNPQTYKTIKEILLQAQDLSSNKQLDYVKSACINNPELIDPIMEMLAIAESPDNHVMERSLVSDYIPNADQSTKHESEQLKKGTKVNQYTIIDKIGIGGMGIVYSAQQNYPAERMVALKLIKDTPKQEQLISESNILAKLNHANIANLIEINKNSDGQLYIAMELIKGTDIITWCESNKYSIKQIIQLFQQLCAGISYAHEKGIIHCDIKPNNVLVVNKNNIATVKIIDFGISQFENNKDNDDISGTPAYLAPEVLNQKDEYVADTRRDVYALGVLLKKILCKISDVKLPKDLKVIIDKSTAVDKQTRYASPIPLSDDLTHFLIKKPVSARHHNFWYLTHLYIRRHFIVVLTSMALIVALIGGYFAQSRQADIANTARLEAEKMSVFLTDIFNVANPEKSQTDSLKAIDLLDNAQKKLLAIEAPTLSDARFMHTVGTILTRLGHLKDAKKIIEKSLQLKQKYLNESDSEIIQGLIQLGLLNKNLDEFVSAENNLNQAIKLLEQQEDTDLLQLSYAYNHLGNLFFKTQDFDKAIIQHQAAIKIRKRFNDKKLLADSYNNLGVIYRERNELLETKKYMHLALDLYVQEYGEYHPFVAIVKNNLAKVEENLHNYNKAEQLLIDANAIFNKSYGASHYNTIISLTNLILFYERRMRYPEAIEFFEASIEKLDETTNYNKKLSLMSWAAFIYAKNNQIAQSTNLYQQIISLIIQKQPTEKYLFEKVYTRYAKSLILQKQFESAEKLLTKAIEHNKKQYAVNNYMSLYILRLKGEIAFETQKFEVAKLLFQQIINVSSQQRLVVVEQISALIDLAKIEIHTGNRAETHKALNSALTLNNSIKSSNQKTKAIIFYQIALTYLAEDNLVPAKAAFDKALAIQLLELPINHPDLLNTQDQILNLDFKLKN